MQAVKTVARGIKFYWLLPDKENTDFAGLTKRQHQQEACIATMLQGWLCSAQLKNSNNNTKNNRLLLSKALALIKWLPTHSPAK